MIVIQLASKKGSHRRVPLLTPVEAASKPAVAGGVEDPDDDQPKVLTGDLRRRMMHDPEVLARIRMLKTGGIIAGSILLFMVLAHLLNLWSGLASLGNWVSLKLRPGAAQEQVVDSVPLIPSPRTVPMPVDLVEIPPAHISTSKARPNIPRGTPVLINVPSVDQAVTLEPSKMEQKAALDALMAFLSARTVDERLTYVRERAVVEPKMREYYARRGDVPTAFERVELVEENAGGRMTYTFSVVLGDGVRRPTLVGKTVSGAYAVDWPSFVIYSEMDWDAFRAARPKEPKMFRALASSSTFFQGTFSDPTALVCLRVIDPLNLEAPALFAYAEAATPLGRAITELAQKASSRAVPIMLRLKYPAEAADPNQVWIHELVGPGWVSRQW